MKLFSASAAALISLLASSTLAADTTNLRAGAGSAMLERELPGATKSTGNTKNGGVEWGEPSYLEFYNGKCVGFDQEKEGQEAKLVSCGDSDASYVTYRDDGLIEIYSTSNNSNMDLCLEERGSRLTLYECDDNEEAQRWFFRQRTIKGKKLYRICSEDNGYCIERKSNAVYLEAFDRNDNDQLIILDSNFFNTN